MRISAFIIWLMLQVFLTSGLGQEQGVYRPGDVLFENPLEKFDLPGFHDNFVIFQDSKGYIWFGHKDGLHRYDGYELKAFMETPITSDDLSSTYVRVMAEDEFGFIWMGCYRKGGLFRYDRRTEKFLRFPRPGKDPETIDYAEIWSVLPDKQGNVWVGTTGYGGGYPLFKYSLETDSFKEYLQDSTDANSIPVHQIFTSYMDEFNNIWFGCQIGLIHLAVF